MKDFKPQKKTGTPLYRQLADYIICLIEKGSIQAGEKMPAVNEANANLQVARDTIISAYKYLQENGWLRSVPGKGFYVDSRHRRAGRRLFVLFDAMNQYKETLYRSLLHSLGKEYTCVTAFHYYDREVFEKLIKEAVGNYDGYVIIPHFNIDISPILKLIPYEKLLLLDGLPRRYDRPCSAVYQDFHNDLYEELTTLYDKLKRYEALHVVFNDRFQFIPNELLSGIHQFYGETQYPITIERDFDVKNLRKGHCYMAISERDLAIILKEMHRRSWEPHEDIGLLSFDDTPLKEVLAGGITTISTDFARMGETAAQLITQGKTRRIANPWVLHDRGSL